MYVANENEIEIENINNEQEQTLQNFQLDDSTDPAPRPKRNSGRTGPTSSAGRQRSSQNSFRHGSCSNTLVLPTESEHAWVLLLHRWHFAYQPADDSIEYDFILKTAQAEWFRIRCQRNYDFYCDTLGGRAPFNWSPEEFKMHDLLLRYKNSADRAFHREHRALVQHYNKLNQSKKLAPAPPEEEQQPEQPVGTITTFVGIDPDSPTGYTILSQVHNGGKILDKIGQPFTPPNPLPPDWPKYHHPAKKETDVRTEQNGDIAESRQLPSQSTNIAAVSPLCVPGESRPVKKETDVRTEPRP